jgi:hypothetical protein
VSGPGSALPLGHVFQESPSIRSTFAGLARSAGAALCLLGLEPEQIVVAEPGPPAAGLVTDWPA